MSLVLRHRQIQVLAGADEAGGDVCAGENHAIAELLSRKHGHLLTFAMLKKEANQHAIAQGARRSWKPSLLRSSAASAGLRFQRGRMSTWLRLHSSKSAASSEINTASGSAQYLRSHLSWLRKPLLPASRRARLQYIGPPKSLASAAASPCLPLPCLSRYFRYANHVNLTEI